MITDGNKKKNKQLGMSHGTASNRLRKQILFSMLQRYEEDVCFQCGEKIKRVEDLSIEHKAPWMDSEDPVGLFFDLDNIAFSHLSCNCKAGRKRNGKTLRIREDGLVRCYRCKQYLPPSMFRMRKETKSPNECIYESCCRSCSNNRRSEHRDKARALLK